MFYFVAADEGNGSACVMNALLGRDDARRVLYWQFFNLGRRAVDWCVGAILCCASVFGFY